MQIVRSLFALPALILALVAGADSALSAQAGNTNAPGRALRGETVVVELFTAQGCDACPAANDLVTELAENPDVITLTYAVDYWDYLGWADTYAKPEFSQRQQAYTAWLKLRDVYTPQVIIDGRVQLSGTKRDDVTDAVQKALSTRDYPPDIQFISGNRVLIGSSQRLVGRADVLLVRYDPDVNEVAVKRGDNKGLTLSQPNMVRDVVRVGTWTGRPVRLSLPADGPRHAGLKAVVLIQSQKTGRIIGAARR
ncbi:MAG: DUF1223 domain-containing protein [Asticcacaulis sp.]